MAAEKADDVIYGIFKCEIKNRFLCTVQVNGEDVTCYIPSSCRLSNFIDMRNRTVLLRPVAAENARTAYSVYAVKYRRSFILLNLSQVNRVIEAQLCRRYFSYLGKNRRNVIREYKIEAYKTDLYLPDTRTLVEIKSILSFDKCGLFPTVYSERAIKQLCQISRLLNQGYQASYLFVSLNPAVTEIQINKSIEEFYQLFIDCVEKGMTYSGISIRLMEGEPQVYARIPVRA